MGCEVFNRGMQIHVPHRDSRLLEPSSDLRAEPRHQQRVSAEVVEEVILNRNAIDLHDFGKRIGERALDAGARFDMPIVAGGYTAAPGPRQRKNSQKQ